MKLIRCDRCGAELRTPGVWFAMNTPTGQDDLRDQDPDFARADFCKACAKAIKMFAFANTSTADTPKEKKAPAKPKGGSMQRRYTEDELTKMLVLARAGWKVKDIAAEFSTSPASMSNTLTRAERLLADGKLHIEGQKKKAANPLEMPNMI